MVEAGSVALLGHNCAFGRLPGSEVALIAAASRMRTFRKGEVVFHRGDPADVLHVVCHGTLKVVLTSTYGRDVVLAILGPGDLFGELALLDDQPRSATVIALEEVETAALGRVEFWSLLRRSPAAAEGLLAALARTIRRNTETVSDLICGDVYARLAKALLELARTHGRPALGGVMLMAPLTQNDLSNMVGATRSSVNKALGVFEDLGLLRRGRRIVLMDICQLRIRADAGCSG